MLYVVLLHKTMLPLAGILIATELPQYLNISEISEMERHKVFKAWENSYFGCYEISKVMFVAFHPDQFLIREALSN